MAHVWKSCGVAMLLMLAATCRDADAVPRSDSTVARSQRVVGAWDAVLWLDRPISMHAETQRLPLRVTGTTQGDVDSLYVVLNPGRDQPAVLFHGEVHGDSSVGIWSTESMLGGGGRYVLTRRAAPNRPPA